MRRRLLNAASLFKYRMMLLAAFCWRRLLFRTRFIAITGSVGKTTTRNLLAAILRDMPALTLAATKSSNSAKQIARDLLSVRPRHRFVVLEVGTDRPGWIRRSAWLIRPDIAIVLSVARTHTNNFPTLDDTAAEKAALLGGLGRKGVAILNVDDERVADGRELRRSELFVLVVPLTPMFAPPMYPASGPSVFHSRSRPEESLNR